jgi:hypothetical protein
VSSKSYGVVAPDVLKSYDGLGFLKAIIDGTVPNPPISELMGFHLVEAEEGRAVFESVPEFHHYNPIGTVHGGFAATSTPHWAARFFQQSPRATPGRRLSSNSIWCVRSPRTQDQCARRATSCTAAVRLQLQKAISGIARADFTRTPRQRA